MDFSRATHTEEDIKSLPPYTLLVIFQPSNIPLCVHVLITQSCVNLVGFDKPSILLKSIPTL